MTHAADFWFDQLGRYPVLSKFESLSLFQQIQKGKKKNGELNAKAQRALEKVVCHNMRFVVQIWRTQYAHLIKASNSQLPDLFQEGAYGLHRAAMNFDPKLGYEFSTYASFWIRRYVNIWLSNRNRVVRAPLMAITVANYFDQIRYKHSYPACVAMCASKYKISEHLVKDYLECVYKTTLKSELALFRADIDQASPSPEELFIDKRFDLIASRAQLDPKEREILLAFQQGFSLKDLPKAFPDDPHVVKRYQAIRQRFTKAAEALKAAGSLSVA